MPYVEFNRSASDFEWKFEITSVVRYAASGKAYLIDSELFADPVWFPVSQTQVDDDGSGPMYLLASDWIMNAKFNEGNLDRTEFYNHVKVSAEERLGPVFNLEDAKQPQVFKRQLVCPSCGAVHDYDQYTEPTVQDDGGRPIKDALYQATAGYKQPEHNPDAPVDIDSDIPF